MDVYDSFIECYNANREKIATKTRKGAILDLHHFEIKGDLSLVSVYVGDIFKETTTRPIKLNLAFGYVIKTLADEKFKYYHPSNNNPFLLNTKLIQTTEDESDLVSMLAPDNILEFVYSSALESSWVVHAIVSCGVRVYKMTS